LLVTVFHKVITTGHQRLQPLFDCLLTILVNGRHLFTEIASSISVAIFKHFSLFSSVALSENFVDGRKQ